MIRGLSYTFFDLLPVAEPLLAVTLRAKSITFV
jgi:hypothetical protein